MASSTIYALASGRPPAAISIVRISGPDAHFACNSLAGSLPAPRQAAVRQLRSTSGELLDEALVLRFDAPASSTGEDVVELHCHGGRAVVDAVLAALSGISGLRPAEPGEFTRRAFENGRLDLTAAEGLADLVEAETQAQRRSALLMAEGALSRQIENWQQRLLDLAARAEAAIDYVDEDIGNAEAQLSRDCDALAKELGTFLERPRARPLREGVLVVIAGPPNAGKSSLLNALVGYERAIVTDVPGTTRDHIEVPMALDDVSIRLTDTAGLRHSADIVEAIGVERAHSLAARADVLVWLGEPDQAPRHSRLIPVHPRCDLCDRHNAPAGSIAVSAKSGAGLSELVAAITNQARAILPTEGEIALNERQAAHVSDALADLRRAAALDDLVLVADSLRSARLAFDRLTGRAGVEEVLDALFSRFCLGK